MVFQEQADSPRRVCYGCGEDNPEGLQIDFMLEGGGAVGRFLTRVAHQGFPCLTHGGISAAALDEALGWAMYAAGVWALTARMEVRYRQAAPLDEDMTVRARVERDRGGWPEASAELRDTRGEVLVEASGLFRRIPAEQAPEFEEFYLDASTGEG